MGAKLMDKFKTKEYIFSNTVTVVEETTIHAKSYEDAESLFLAGKGKVDIVDEFGGDWSCTDNPDQIKESDND
tara:strand:- start:236 stop:454 length:219 start_codon:yes stop_codon:yes gene_type:complete